MDVKLTEEDLDTIRAVLRQELQRLDEGIEKLAAACFFAGEDPKGSSQLAGMNDARKEVADILTRCHRTG